MTERWSLSDELGLVPVALRYFTRLPSYSRRDDQERLDRSIRYLPLVGIIIGGLTGLSFLLAERIWPLPVAAALAMAFGALLTGGLHEDGLADFCDAFFTQRDRDGVLEIMKDPRLGTYGVLGLVLTLLVRFAVLIALAPADLAASLIAAHAFSRLIALIAMRTLPYARTSDAAPKPESRPLGRNGAAIAGLCGCLPLALPGRHALLAALLAAAAGFVVAWICRRRIGGYTGDCLGAIQQLSELAFYLGILA